MRKFLSKHGLLWKDPQYIVAVLLGLIFFAGGIFATYYANIYSTVHASNAVTDIILDNIPVVNVDFVFTDGVTIFAALILVLAFFEPRRIPFILKSVALFTVVRAIFLILTHTAPPSPHSFQDPKDFLYKLSSGDDLFFSEHTGLPFMFAFIFWDEKWLRYMFFVFTFIGAAAVLLGHLHYSIDVFSALFIAFGIYHLAINLFPKDFARLKVAGKS